VLAFAALGSACDRNYLHTGTATPIKPTSPPTPAPVQPDGTCASGLSTCGGAGAGYCFDLQSAPDHCGACGSACPLGVPCDNGRCRIVPCTQQITVKSMRVDYDFGTRYQIALADLDRDGALDMVAPTPNLLAVANGWNPGNDVSMGASVFHGQGDGTFVAGESYPADSHSSQGFAAYAVDLNRDQIPDLVMRAQPTADLLALPSEAITVVARLGKGDGTFGPEIGLAGGAAPTFITLADLDGDGAPDLVGIFDQTQAVAVYRGNGDGSFGSRKDLPVGGSPATVFATDWNGDGIVDLVATDDYLHLLLGKGNGDFASVLDCGVSLLNPEIIMGTPPPPVLGDFDSDGIVDMVANNTLLLGMHECSVTRATAFPVAYNAAYPIAAGDFNGDGTTDLAVAFSDGIGFLPGDGHGNLGTLVRLGDLDVLHEVPMGTTGYAADVNGDGRLDLIVANRDSIRVFLNTCK